MRPVAEHRGSPLFSLGSPSLSVECPVTRGGLFIGKVAQQAGSNPKTIRYYETIGLLPKPQRGENRYRIYSEETVELLQFIKKAQGLGLSLSEIREIIELRRRGCEPCIHVRALLARRIADLDQRLSDLVALRKKLERLLAGSGKQSKQEGARVTVCPHIEGISPEVKPRGHKR